MKLPSTFSVLATLGIIGAAWEIYTLCNRAHGDTFSATVCELGEGQPFIPFISGMLNRHLFSEGRSQAAFLAGYAAGVYWPLTDKRDVEAEPDA